MKPRPSFDSLPLREGDPPHSAWGLYGENDQLGCLNLLTPENTLAASQEVKTGVRLSLDPPLDALVRPGVGRACLEHDVILRQDVPGIYVHDDTLTLNTQVRPKLLKPLHLSTSCSCSFIMLDWLMSMSSPELCAVGQLQTCVVFSSRKVLQQYLA